MSARRVVIIGGKGTAVNVAEQIEDARCRYGYPLRVEGFAIDDKTLGREISGFPVVAGVRSAWERYAGEEVSFLFALYRPDVLSERLSLLRELGIPKDRFATFIHPQAYVSRSARIGVGNIVMSQSTIHHGASLGDFNIINSNVVIEHDASLCDGVFLAAGACIGARTLVESSTFIGLNATIREDVRLAVGSFVGMGSAVTRDVDADSVVYGVPARPVS